MFQYTLKKNKQNKTRKHTYGMNAWYQHIALWNVTIVHFIFPKYKYHTLYVFSLPLSISLSTYWKCLRSVSLWQDLLGTWVIMRVRETVVATSLSSSFFENRRVNKMPSGRKRKASVTWTHISRDLRTEEWLHKCHYPHKSFNIQILFQTCKTLIYFPMRGGI